MPTPEFTGLGDNPTLSDVVDYVYKLEKELNYLLQNLDTSNVNRLDAKVVKTGTLDANLVTIRSDLSGTSYLQIDTNGIRANNGTINTFEIDSTGNAYFRGNVTSDATITGATIRTGVPGTNRIELSGGVFSGYTDTNERSGLYFTVLSTGIADLFLYHLGAQRLTFYDEVTYYTIKPGIDATQMGLGASGTTVYAYGTWDFNSTSTTVQGLTTDDPGDHNHGITPGTTLLYGHYDSATSSWVIDGNVAFAASGAHTHTVIT